MNMKNPAHKAMMTSSIRRARPVPVAAPLRGSFLLAVACLILFLGAGPVQGQLEWRVSIKFILDATGNRPSGSLDTEAEIRDQIDLGNEVLDATGRGFRLRLVEVLDVAGISQWYNADVSSSKGFLNFEALSDPSLYRWNTTAINVYVNNDNSPGICSFPGDGSIILVGQGLRPTTIIHEIGHYLNLCHTQGCECGSCDSGETGECHTTPGNDFVPDTLPDLSCWTRNDISQNAFGTDYGFLGPENQVRVDRTFNNIMSYHGTRFILTSDQMDRMTDASNLFRDEVATGRTVFVDNTSDCLPQTGNLNCFLGFGGPLTNVLAGSTEASVGDILMIRGSTYSETFTFAKPLTVRARKGNAVIGLSPFATLTAEPAAARKEEGE